jgi:fumarate hydratase subunit alpha
MKIIQSKQIFDAVKDACISIQSRYSPEMETAITNAMNKETGVGKSILRILLDNSELASTQGLPMCQDTGMIVAWVQLGNQVTIEGGFLNQIINDAVKDAYDIAYLRKSVVKDPLFERDNTKDNTPAVIHVDLIESDQLIINITAKGFGSENMSALKMLTPADGLEGAREFILDTVKHAGPNACPPMVVGVGVGGTMDQAAWLAKRALYREIGDRNQNPTYAQFELELLTQINELGIGPQGLGGNTTALEVFTEYFPTHIAGLPIAVNINCHMTRHKQVIL